MPRCPRIHIQLLGPPTEAKLEEVDQRGSGKGLVLSGPGHSGSPIWASSDPLMLSVSAYFFLLSLTSSYTCGFCLLNLPVLQNSAHTWCLLTYPHRCMQLPWTDPSLGGSQILERERQRETGHCSANGIGLLVPSWG